MVYIPVLCRTTAKLYATRLRKGKLQSTAAAGPSPLQQGGVN